MMKSSFVIAFLLAGATSATAAPLDALLSANKKSLPGSFEIEAAYDVMNSTVDIFNIRDNDDEFAGTNVGDYHGAHIRGGVALTSTLSIDGALWQRKIDYRQDQGEIDSWQIAGQYKFMEAIGRGPSMALRLSAWGNSADALNKTSPTTFRGITLDTIRVEDPKDRQLQLDLIASWALRDDLEVTGFVGGGTSKTEIGAIGGALTEGGCRYNLAFERGGPAVARCTDGSGAISVPNTVLDVFAETEYKANFFQTGFSGKWTTGPWLLRAGYQFQYLNRDNIDDTLEARGQSSYKNNHIVVGEIAYKVMKNVSLFGRGQYMSNQFVGEIPLVYNTFTARRFDKHYGIVSAGLLVEF